MLNVDNASIEAAKKLGTDCRRTDMGKFSEPWTVNLGKTIGWATVYTGYHNVAYAARKASVERRELGADAVARALEIGRELTFTAAILGDFSDFANEYHSVLELDNKIVSPVFEYVPEFAEASEFWPDAPAYIAGCVFKFPVEAVKEDSVVTLTLTPFDGDVLHFVFDLAKMR